MKTNYQIMVWRDSTWETIDEHDPIHLQTDYRGYAVRNPDGVYIGPQNMPFDEALSFCQRLRRVTSSNY